MVVVVVKASYLERAVVRAVTGTDAAVVDHIVKAFFAVNGGGNWANLLTWGVLTLHTPEWLRKHLRRLLVTDKVPVNSEPMHFATLLDLVLANNWDIVFGGAGNDTRVTAGTRCEVDRHTPFMTFVFVLVEERKKLVLRKCVVLLVRSRWILLVGIQVHFANKK